MVTIELQHSVLRPEQAPDLVQLGRRMASRARDEDLELLARKQLALRPAPHASDGLSPVELERDDHGEPQCRRHDEAGRYPKTPTRSEVAVLENREPEKGIEPLTCSLRVSRSAD